MPSHAPYNSRYPNLTKNFFKGRLHGQVLSIWKAQTANPSKVEDFRRAVADGVITLAQLDPLSWRKLRELGGFLIPPGADIKPARIVKEKIEVEPDLEDATEPTLRGRGRPRKPPPIRSPKIYERAATGLAKLARAPPIPIARID